MSKEATTGADTATKSPSGVGEAISMFQSSQEAEAAAKKPEEETVAAKTEEAAKKEPPESPPAEKGGKAAEEAKKTDGAKLRLVDENGEEMPLVFKSDGKELSEKDLDKIRRYVEQGYHGSQRAEALDAKEKLLNEQLAVIELVQQAMKDGRLIIKDQEAGSEKKEEEVEEDLLADPKVKKLEERVKKNEEELQKTAGLFIKESVDKAYRELKGQIEAKKAECPYARESEVWKLLELQDEKTGKPLHDVESAMKKANEGGLAFIESAPLPEKIRQQVIADYLKEKAEAEAAPVGSPAGAAPGGIGGADKEEKKPITGIADAIERFKREMESKGGSPSQF